MNVSHNEPHIVLRNIGPQMNGRASERARVTTGRRKKKRIRGEKLIKQRIYFRKIITASTF